MPLDTNVFDKIQTFSDYDQLNKEFQLRKAVAAQQLQTSGIENQAKQLSLVGQIVGNNSVDQPSYDRARQAAQAQGLDISALPDEYNPDIVNRLRFAGATPTAQLTAIIASQGHQLKAGIATGDVGAYGYGSSGGIGTTTPAPSAPAKSPTTAENAQKIVDVFDPTDTPAQPIVLSTDQPSSTAAPKFSFRPQNPSETTQAYTAAQDAAFKQFNLNNAAAIKAQESAGSESGKLGVENAEAAKKADELTKRLEMNLNAMLQLNPNVPSTGFIPGSWKAAGDQALAANGLSTGATATAANQWDQINNQQILSEIQQFIASGGANTRTNQTLERIVRAASGINRNDLPKSREAQIKNALAEIQNKNVSAQNLAGGSEQYQPVPVVTSQPATPQPGSTMPGTDGTYLFNGGDPSKPENWKKVK